MSRIPLHGLQRGKDTELDFEKTASTPRSHGAASSTQGVHADRRATARAAPHRKRTKKTQKRSQPGSLAGERPVLITSR